MAAKKPGEREWKIAAVNRLIADEQARISTLEATLPASSVAACHHCWNGEGFGVREPNPRCERCGGAGIPSHRDLVLGQLAGARGRIAALKKLKRRPGDLLTLAHKLRDARGLERLRRRPTGSEDVLAALEAEQQRLVKRRGSVEAYFEYRDTQRTLAKEPRGKSDNRLAVSHLIELLANVQDEDGTPAPARALWPHLRSAIDNEFGSCEESVGAGGRPLPLLQQAYRYRAGGRERRISYKQFRGVLGEQRRALRR